MIGEIILIKKFKMLFRLRLMIQESDLELKRR